MLLNQKEINMEKDYFKDRPIEATQSDKIKVGMEVYICSKSMQTSAKNLNDLSKGIITKILTRHSHPRGLKCEIAQTPNGARVIGRVIYIVQKGLVLTKNGLKAEKDVNK